MTYYYAANYSQPSLRHSTTRLLGLVLSTSTLGAVLATSACSHADPSSSEGPYYRQGYDQLTNDAHQAVAKLADQEGLHESMAQFLGSAQQAATFCEGLLESKTAGAALGSAPQLPTDFSSADFLRGCNDAAKAILASGQ